MANKKAYNINDAIVEKVRSILNNTDRTDYIHISIESNVGELPTIRYNISELLVLKEETDGKNSEV